MRRAGSPPKKGELYQRYHKGMEDQLGALGLVLNCVVLCLRRINDHARSPLDAVQRHRARSEVPQPDALTVDAAAVSSGGGASALASRTRRR